MRAMLSMLAVIALASVFSPAQSAAQVVSPDSAVRLIPGDMIRLEVRDEPEMSGEFTVGQDGTVLLPIVGSVRVANRPFGEVRDEIGKLMARELVNPAFRVTPVQRIAVLGEVRMPGLIPVDASYTLSDVLARAGGLTPAANPRKVSLVRSGSVVAARLEPGSPTLALGLQSGDQIIVARRSWIHENTPVLIGFFSSVVTAVVAGLVVR